MGKFKSHDGVDVNSVRAEVSVMTGTGRIKEIVSKGENSRNVEIIFDPDNPMLKRKVAGFLATDSKEIWEYAQKAFADKSDISYRIESQRKRGVDRSIPFDDLKHDEQVVRILAAIDNVYSTEAKTNPKEDPVKENPSALYDEQPEPVKEDKGSSVSKGALLLALNTARSNNLSEVVIDTLIAQALATGAIISEVFPVNTEEPELTPVLIGRAVAKEEKPWFINNSDGRPNAGAYMVTHAATAEQFALDHLINLYSQGKKSNVDVSNKMLSQAASIALELLDISDEVQSFVTGARANRQSNSYGRALSLVLDAVAKRYPAPLGENNLELVKIWHKSIVEEASERLYGIMEVAHGRLPRSIEERSPEPKEKALEIDLSQTAKPKVKTTTVATEEPKVLSSKITSAAEALGAKIIPVSSTPVESTLVKVDEDFTPASPEQVLRVKAICEAAGVMAYQPKIINWLGNTLGVKVARQADAFVLEEWLTKYEAMDSKAVFAEVTAE